MSCLGRRIPLLCVVHWSLAVLLMLNPGAMLKAEYADVVLNERSEQEGMRPVIFPHWFHRIRFQCRVCHGELGFAMRAGANEISMQSITEGRHCGACHNGDLAWPVENCDLCHSGKPGLATGIRGGHQTLGPGDW